MTTSNKILYFLMGALFAVAIGWSLYRPVEAVAPSTVERKVDVLSDREVGRLQKDIATLENAIQADRDFLTTKYTAVTGKSGGSSQYAQRKADIDRTFPEKEKRLEQLREWMKTLKM